MQLNSDGDEQSDEVSSFDSETPPSVKQKKFSKFSLEKKSPGRPPKKLKGNTITVNQKKGVKGSSRKLTNKNREVNLRVVNVQPKKEVPCINLENSPLDASEYGSTNSTNSFIKYADVPYAKSNNNKEEGDREENYKSNIEPRAPVILQELSEQKMSWNAENIAERIKSISAQSSFSNNEKIEQFWKLLTVTTIPPNMTRKENETDKQGSHSSNDIQKDEDNEKKQNNRDDKNDAA